MELGRAGSLAPHFSHFRPRTSAALALKLLHSTSQPKTNKEPRPHSFRTHRDNTNLPNLSPAFVANSIIMSSSTSRPGERMVHQDFIARIRYSNALPPPPHPPKLLDIPNTGLASGQYTTPGFASRLAREQPLNIEADAELGMPLDLVGMPGVFDGDERCKLRTVRVEISCI